uniref:Uncharacterized protein n=1 Tax=Pararge aegeria TaxID=116150 RepID=S4PRW5_9NEOP
MWIHLKSPVSRDARREQRERPCVELCLVLLFLCESSMGDVMLILMEEQKLFFHLMVLYGNNACSVRVGR